MLVPFCVSRRVDLHRRAWRDSLRCTQKQRVTGGDTASKLEKFRLVVANTELDFNPFDAASLEPHDVRLEAALINGIKIAKERGSTIILVTHKTNVLGIADKVLVLMNGQVQHLGDRQSVLGKLMGPRVAQLNQPEPSMGGAVTAG